MDTRVQVSKDDTIILGGDGDKGLIEDRCQIIREAVENTQSDYEKEKLQERLAKIAGGVAVIKVPNHQPLVSLFCFLLGFMREQYQCNRHLMLFLGWRWQRC